MTKIRCGADSSQVRSLVRDLKKAIGHTQDADPIETLAAEARAGLTSFTWTGWVEQASRLGVRRVVLADLGAIDGRLVYSRGGYFIYINRRQPRSRQLFSLAHELGHMLLEQKLPYLSSDCKERSLFHPDYDQGEERLADNLAAALIMPRTHVVELASEYLADLTAIIAVSQRFSVSVDAAVRRIAEVRPFVGAMFLFDYKQHHDVLDLHRQIVWRLPFRNHVTRPWRLSRQDLRLGFQVGRLHHVCIPLPVAPSTTEIYNAQVRWRSSRSAVVLVHQTLTPLRTVFDLPSKAQTQYRDAQEPQS